MDSQTFQQALANSFVVSPGRAIQRVARGIFGNDDLKVRIAARRRRRDLRLDNYELMIDKSDSVIERIWLRWNKILDRMDDWVDTGIIFLAAFVPEPLRGLSPKFALTYLLLSLLYFGVMAGFIVLMELTAKKIWLSEFTAAVVMGSIIFYSGVLLFFYKKGKDYQFSYAQLIKKKDLQAKAQIASANALSYIPVDEQEAEDDTFAGMPRYSLIKNWKISRKLVASLVLMTLLSIAVIIADIIIILVDSSEYPDHNSDVLKLYTVPLNWYAFHTIILVGAIVLTGIFGSWLAMAILPPAGYRFSWKNLGGVAILNSELTSKTNKNAKPSKLKIAFGKLR